MYHHLIDVRLDRDVAVRTVEDASCLKTPTVVCHAFDRRLVFAREGNVYKVAAITERVLPDARHAIRNRHRCQTGAIVECTAPDARHAL